jgi:hypothetical protein
VRFIAREIRTSGVLDFECDFRSLISSFDHLRRGARFSLLAFAALFDFIAFFAIYFLLDDEVHLHPSHGRVYSAVAIMLKYS